MTDKPFLTIGEVADILQVSSRTVYNLIYKGTLRACRLTYHITIITKEDFFLMIRETTYCKRSVSIFARQGKKTKKKMNEDTPNTEKDLSQTQLYTLLYQVLCINTVCSKVYICDFNI